METDTREMTHMNTQTHTDEHITHLQSNYLHLDRTLSNQKQIYLHTLFSQSLIVE